MVLNPFRDEGYRYPDETIVPTGMVHLVDSVTWTMPSTGSTGNFTTALQAKPVRTTSNGGPPIPAPGQPNPFTISPPNPFAVGTGLSPIPTSDYGANQTSWANLSAIDRTLASAIRVRMVGLPPSQFMPAGSLYFLQLQREEFFQIAAPGGLQDYNGEALAMQMVTAGKGFVVTVNELNHSDGVCMPLLPQGPMSYVFSDTDSYGAAYSGATAGTSTVVSAPPYIVVVGYGIPPGSVLRFDYTHWIEYIPETTAAGLISTAVCPPSYQEREAVSRVAQTVQSQIAGKSSIRDVAGLLSDNSAVAAGTLARSALGMMPGGSAIASILGSGARSLSAPGWLGAALRAM